MIEADRSNIARLESLGSTRPITESTNWDVSFAAEGIRFFAEFADKLGGEVISTRSDNLGMVVAQPYGVVAAITPWNVPIVNLSWKTGPALAAGNAIVLKPSELRHSQRCGSRNLPSKQVFHLAFLISFKAMGLSPAMRFAVITSCPKLLSRALVAAARR